MCARVSGEACTAHESLWVVHRSRASVSRRSNPFGAVALSAYLVSVTGSAWPAQHHPDPGFIPGPGSNPLAAQLNAGSLSRADTSVVSSTRVDSAAWYTWRPERKVASTVISAIVSGSTRWGSADSTTMSAYLPTSREPTTSSANSCHAASMVCARMACSTVSCSSGASTFPLGALRVTATLMLRNGSSGVTGGSLCSEIRIPVSTADLARTQWDPWSGPNRSSTSTSPQ